MILLIIENVLIQLKKCKCFSKSENIIKGYSYPVKTELNLWWLPNIGMEVETIVRLIFRY